MNDVSLNNLNMDEQKLNPPPYSYRVPSCVRYIFVIFSLVGILGYLYSIIDRRTVQKQYLMTNQMAGIRLIEKPLSYMSLKNPISEQALSLSQSSISGHTLIVIWATWCSSCQQEMPSLEVLQKHFKDKISIIAISVDDDLEPVKKFIETTKPSFQVLWDQEKKIPAIFKVDKYPESFLVDEKGFVTTQFSGARDWASRSAIEYFTAIIK